MKGRSKLRGMKNTPESRLNLPEHICFREPESLVVKARQERACMPACELSESRSKGNLLDERWVGGGKIWILLSL
jgi:hypothetical protein